jgi:hypothetical protein
MGPILLAVVGGVFGSAAGQIFESLPGKRARKNDATPTPTKGSTMFDDEVGADEIYIETSGDDDEVGASKGKAKTKKCRSAFRRICFLPQTAIATTATAVLPVVVNAPFLGIGLRMSGANQNLLSYNGTIIRGRPQEGSSGSVGCGMFDQPDFFMWQWDTVNPGENFTLSFTNTHTASVSPSGYLVGYLAP